MTEASLRLQGNDRVAEQSLFAAWQLPHDPEDEPIVVGEMSLLSDEDFVQSTSGLVR